MATNNEPPKPQPWPDHGPTYRDWVDYVIRNSSHATQVLTPGGWSEWDAGRYARQQYEEMRAELAALRAEVARLARWQCSECGCRFNSPEHDSDPDPASCKRCSRCVENETLRAEVERLEESVKTLRELREYDAKALATARDAALEEAASVLNEFGASPQHLGSVHLWCREKCADAIRDMKGTK